MSALDDYGFEDDGIDLARTPDERRAGRAERKPAAENVIALRQFQGVVVHQRRLSDGSLWLPESQPLDWARLFMADQFLGADGVPDLASWRGEWREWTGTHWRLMPAPEMRAKAYAWLGGVLLQKLPTRRGDEVDYVAFPASRRTVDDTLDAMSACVLIPETTEPFSWRGKAEVPAEFVLPCGDGLVDLRSGRLLGPRREFLATAVPDWRWDRRDPAQWLAFLNEAFEGDAEQIALLQEATGLLLSGCTDIQSIVGLIGAPGAGKGVVVRVLMHLLGADLAASLSSSAFAAPFGLQSVIGKRLAAVPDLRIGAAADQAAVSERLLQISGGDHVSVGRKYASDWQGLPTARLAFAANEMPRLRDDSGALARRLVPVVFMRSFAGREDPALTRKLAAEAAGIVRWAGIGLMRLLARGRFDLPEPSRRLVGAGREENSPFAAFAADELEAVPGGWINTDRAFEIWVEWCNRHGEKPGTSRAFGRAVKAAFPSVERERAAGGRGETRGYVWRGLRRSEL